MSASKDRRKHLSPQSRISLAGIFSFLVFIALFLYPNSAFPGLATLTWNAPATNTDGTPLTDLSGYKIYYGTASGNYSQTIDVGGITSSTVSNLTDGTTYYFAVTAYDTSGNESAYSNEVSKTTQAVQQYSLAITKSGTGSGTVTSSAGGINCGTACTATYSPGSVVTLTAAPAGGSTFMGWSGGGCAGTGTCSLSMNGNIAVTATFGINTYSITATAGAGGTISPSGTVTVNSGTSKTFTIAPSAGYSIGDVKVDGTSVGAVTTYTFSNVTANHVIAATFVVNTYIVTPSAGANGSVSPSTAMTVNYNGTASFTVTPNTGYNIVSVTGCGGMLSGSTYTTGLITANCTVTATFGINTYSITSTAGAGGTISPSGTVTVNSGTSKTFTIAPSAGYSIGDVKVDGTSVGAVATYTLSNVTANHVIAATFVVNTYIVTPSAGANGSVSPSTAMTVNYNGTASFTVTPNTGYNIVSVTGCGGMLSGSTYTTGLITANCTVTATFGINTYSITSTAGAGGTISPSGTVTVNSGTSKTFTITPNTGYSISEVIVDSLSAGAVTSYSFTNVTGNHSLSVSFAPLDFDDDGISDIEEWGPQGNDSNYDGNNDGVPDYLQNSVASLHTAGSNDYITLFSADGYALKDVMAEPVPEGTPVGAELPYQFISFTVDEVAAGASTTVVVKLPDGVVVNDYYKYGPTPDNPALHWYSFMFDGQTGAEISGNIITLHFVDGLRGDDDLTANGQIVDQGGPAETPVVGATPSSIGFGTTAVNTTSVTQSVSISNNGLAPLIVSAVMITGSDAGDFVVLGETCSSQTTASAGTCNVSLAFAPHAAGNKNASLTISSDDPRTPILVIPVSGTGTIPQFTLSVTKTGNGTVSSSTTGIMCGSACSTLLNEGTVAILTATPGADSIFTGWSGGGCAGTGTCSLSMNGAVSVTATFAVKTYTIAATAGTGGTISPSGAVTANYGTSKTFAITPSAGYSIGDVKVDGTSVGAVATYTFSNVTVSHAISAGFVSGKIPAISVSPASYVFKTTKVGYSSSKMFKITNIGKANLSILKVEIIRNRCERVQYILCRNKDAKSITVLLPDN